MFALSRLIKQSDDGATPSAPPPSSSRSHTSPQYKELTLLFSRLSSSTLHEDRRQSITALHELTGQHSDLPLSPSQLEQLLALADDMQRDDPDISRLALQSVHQLLTPPQPGQGGSSDRTSQLELVSLFASNPHYTHLLLSFLSSSHFHLRFTGMQLLTQLLMEKAARDRLQQSIIASGGSVMQLVELLDDGNEVIRGEALLLLEALIHRSADIQKMIAFNGGFDSLLMTVKREGGLLEAGVIGEDAMRLVCGLLQDNRSNQQLFAEMGCAKLLAMLLQSAEQRLSATVNAQGGGGDGLRDESQSSLCFVLDAISYVSSSSASLPSLAPLVAPLFELSLNSQLPESMRYTCLSLVATMVDGCKQGQQALSTLRLPSLGHGTHSPSPSSPIVLLANRALDASPRLLGTLSLHAVRCFFHSNKDAQLQAVMSLSPSASQSPVAVGPLLLPPFSSRTSPPPQSSTSLHSWSGRATAFVIASELVRGNFESQQLLLKLPLQHSSSPSSTTVTWQDTLLDHMRQQVASATTPGSVSADGVALDESAALCFVCDWINGCAEVAESLFARQSFLQQLLTLATTHASRYVRGLATYAFLLCLQMQSNNGSSTPSAFLTASSLLPLIQHSITLDLFKQNLTALHNSSAFTLLRSASSRDINPFHRYTARRVRKAGGEGQEHVFVVDDGGESEEEEGEAGRVYVFSREFVAGFDKAYEGMNDRLLSLLTAALSSSSGQAATSAPASSADLMRLRDENASLRRDNEGLRAQLSQRSAQQRTAHSGAETTQLQNIVAQQRQEIAELKEDLLMLQHAEEDRSRASAPSSSSALTALQHKYDELQTEHEDLLLLLAQYAQQEEDEQVDSAHMHSGDGDHATVMPYGGSAAAQSPKTSEPASEMAIVSQSAPSHEQNGYHPSTATTANAPIPSEPGAAVAPTTIYNPYVTASTQPTANTSNLGGAAAYNTVSAISPAPRLVPPSQSTSHAIHVSPTLNSSSSFTSSAQPLASTAAPSMDYYQQLYASRLSSSRPSSFSSTPILTAPSTSAPQAYKPSVSAARPAFTPAAPPSLASAGSSTLLRPLSNGR